MSSSEILNALKTLLEDRERIIADHAFRDRDSEAHLSALREVSESIQRLHEEHRPHLDPRLDHFLAQASFAKARAWVTAKLRSTESEA